MSEAQTSQRKTVDVYRGVGLLRETADDTTWRTTYEAGLDDIHNIIRGKYLLRGQVRNEHIQALNTAEEFCTIFPEHVQILELIAINPSTFTEMQDELVGADPRLETVDESELAELLGDDEMT